MQITTKLLAARLMREARTSIGQVVKKNLQGFAVLALSAAALVFCATAMSQKRPASDGQGVLGPVSAKTDLYPADADAKKEIEEALKQATSGGKRVLLIFVANWCYDCHVLDHALHDGDAGNIVSQNFLLVHVDIGEGEKNPDLLKTYKIPLDKGVPAVAVLESNGRLLYSSGEGEFEAARRMLKKDLVGFLNKWKRLRS